MRLIDIDWVVLDGQIRLEEFSDADTPQYVILSHTWGRQEVTFDDVMGGTQCYASKYGFNKIKGCCRRAQESNAKWIWVDTCCINKSSSTELSEAINSMYRFYERSIVCYVYLTDVPEGCDIEEEDSAFRRSRWFTRGWTLQELLAPRRVVFYNAEWNRIGSLDEGELLSLVCSIIGISQYYFKSIKFASVAIKMSWAAGRETTRKEDVAYCLLGIFGINMPMLYGEGERAFVRLQEEILRESDDHSLLAWGLGMTPAYGGVFANSPASFAHCGSIYQNAFPERLSQGIDEHFYMTNKGFHIPVPLFRVPGNFGNFGVAYALLACTLQNDRIALPLSFSITRPRLLFRSRGTPPVTVSADYDDMAEGMDMLYIGKGEHYSSGLSLGVELRLSALCGMALSVCEIFPPVGITLVGKDRIVCSTDYIKRAVLRLADKDGDGLLLRLLQDGSNLDVQMVGFESGHFSSLAEVLVEGGLEDLLSRPVWSETLDLGDGQLIRARIKPWAMKQEDTEAKGVFMARRAKRVSEYELASTSPNRDLVVFELFSPETKKE